MEIHYITINGRKYLLSNYAEKIDIGKGSNVAYAYLISSNHVYGNIYHCTYKDEYGDIYRRYCTKA